MKMGQTDKEKPRLFMFAGQGSQFYGMGKDLYDTAPDFRRELNTLSEITFETTGVDILRIMFDPDKSFSDPFDDQLASNLAIFLVERGLARTLAAREVFPDGVIGSSIGTLGAAVTAGAVADDEAALQIMQRVWRALRDHAPDGGMLAVIDDVTLLETDPALTDLADLAGINFDGSFILSAPRVQLQDLEDYLRHRRIVFQRLAVPYPYHSRWMDVVRVPFLDAVAGAFTARPTIPFLCCSISAPLDNFGGTEFWRAVRMPMHHGRTLSAADASDAIEFIDLSASGTLATLAKYALPQNSLSTSMSILNPFQRGAAERLDEVSYREDGSPAGRHLKMS